MVEKRYDDTIEALEEELRHLCGTIKQKGREILINFEITPPQFAALQVLIKHELMTIGELSAHTFLAYSTITDLVDRMEKNGLVRRIRDEKDRRIVRILVLDKGHEIIKEVLHARKNYLADVLKDLSGQEKDAVLAGVSMIYRRTI